MPKKHPKRIGLAIVGGGRIGLIRGEIAERHAQVDWIGLAEKNPERAKLVAEKIGADFVTGDHRELLARPEATAAIIATDEHLHVAPIMAAVERRLALFIEKPLATDLAESEQVLTAIEQAGVDAVIGYTQRFRRRWLVAKEKVRTGSLGEVTLVTSRAFMNRLVAIDNYKRTNDPSRISPMVISGTHALDIVMWMMEGEARGRGLRPLGRQGARAGMRRHRRNGGHDHVRRRRALSLGDLLGAAGRVARRGLQPGGRDRRHRWRPHDRRHPSRHRARNRRSQGEGYAPDESRRVDFLTSYPPGDIALGELRGPMREETEQLAQSPRPRAADAARDRGRRPQPPHAHEGHRPVGAAAAAGEPADRAGGRAMKLAMFMMPVHPPSRQPSETLAEDREAILLADRLGYRRGLRRRARHRPRGERDLVPDVPRQPCARHQGHRARQRHHQHAEHAPGGDRRAGGDARPHAARGASSWASARAG